MFKVHTCKYEECGKVFYDNGLLKKHQLIHGERQVNLIFFIIRVIRLLYIVSMYCGRLWKKILR